MIVTMRKSTLLALGFVGLLVVWAFVWTPWRGWVDAEPTKGPVVKTTASSSACPEGYIRVDADCITGGDPAFGDGMTLVGKKAGVSPEGWIVVPPGTYRASVDSDYGCYWERRSRADDSLEHVIANGFTAKKNAIVTVTIRKTDKAFRSSGCGRWEWVGGR